MKIPKRPAQMHCVTALPRQQECRSDTHRDVRHTDFGERKANVQYDLASKLAWGACEGISPEDGGISAERFCGARPFPLRLHLIRQIQLIETGCKGRNFDLNIATGPEVERLRKRQAQLVHVRRDEGG